MKPAGPVVSDAARRARRREQWRRYNASDKGVARLLKYKVSDKGIAVARRHSKQQYLGGVTQAWRAANRERVNAVQRASRTRRKQYLEEIHADE